MDMRLYDLTGQYLALQRVAEEGLDVTAELALIEDAIEAKVRGVAAVLRNLDADESVLSAEVARLDAKLNAVRNSKRRLKDGIRDCMVAAGVERVKAPEFTMWLGETESVEVVDESQVPPEYIRTKTTTEVARKDVLSAWRQSGECVPGTTIVSKKHLNIR
jgi:hypothetical protein